MYIVLNLTIIFICLIVIKFLIEDMSIRFTSIFCNYDYKELKKMYKESKKTKKLKNKWIKGEASVTVWNSYERMVKVKYENLGCFKNRKYR